MTAYDPASPWVGLRPFGKDDENRFFGRSIEIRAVAELWREHRLTLLIGDSGVGKTSLLHAGLVPFLTNGGTRVVPVGDPRYRRTLPAPLIPPRSRASFALLTSWQPAEDPARSVGLTIAEFFRMQSRATPVGLPILIAIDGAERVLRPSAASEGGNRRFLEELEYALRAFPSVHMLLSIRPECVDASRRIAHVLGVTPARYDLQPLDRQSAVEALTRPLLGSPVQFEPGVPARLVETLMVEDGEALEGPGVEPVLLQVLCTELWDRLRDGGGPLPALVEKVINDVDGVLAEFCTRTLFTLTTDHDLPTCEIGGWMRRTFTTTSHEARPARRSDRPEEITDAVVRAVEDRHLIKFCQIDSVDCYRLQHPRLAKALQRLGEVPVIRRDPTPVGLLRDAEQAMSVENLELAEKYARAAIAGVESGHSQIHISAHVLLGDIAYARVEHEAARVAYHDALGMEVMADSKSNAVAYLFAALARLQLLQGEPVNALGSARSGRLITADDTITVLEIGQAHWFANRHKAAIKELESILRKEPQHVEALRIRGEIHADAGNTRSALVDLDRIAVAAPPSARVARALAAGSAAQITQKDLEEFREEAQGHGLILLNLARLMRNRGEREAAAQVATEAIEATNPRLSRHHQAEAVRISRGR